ncbi:aldehyde dehydrogenase family 2 member C4-like [Mercurialis annua]|uniref:aldehyde dehydrogenase family 2 member C4-like n=1 Tax=Mercurialis annua TaxID=3986 RepID=UPI00215EB221|nr:aldehyde dehydrogenase family 2 member C4-like [Mercurialis annua]
MTKNLGNFGIKCSIIGLNGFALTNPDPTHVAHLTWWMSLLRGFSAFTRFEPETLLNDIKSLTTWTNPARAKIMMKFVDLIDENIEELAALDTIDAGKLFSLGKAIDIPSAANSLCYYAGAADKIHGEVLKMSRELQGYTLREPIGVVQWRSHLKQ